MPVWSCASFRALALVWIVFSESAAFICGTSIAIQEVSKRSTEIKAGPIRCITNWAVPQFCYFTRRTSLLIIAHVLMMTSASSCLHFLLLLFFRGAMTLSSVLCSDKYFGTSWANVRVFQTHLPVTVLSFSSQFLLFMNCRLSFSHKFVLHIRGQEIVQIGQNCSITFLVLEIDVMQIIQHQFPIHLAVWGKTQQLYIRSHLFYPPPCP